VSPHTDKLLPPPDILFIIEQWLGFFAPLLRRCFLGSGLWGLEAKSNFVSKRVRSNAYVCRWKASHFTVREWILRLTSISSAVGSWNNVSIDAGADPVHQVPNSRRARFFSPVLRKVRREHKQWLLEHERKYAKG